MERRDLLRAMGGAAALALLPRNAHAAWALVRQRSPFQLATLTTQQAAIINAVGDTILPRTDSPSASDVRVVSFIDVIVGEYYTEQERTTFLAGLDGIEASSQAALGASFTMLPPDQRATQIAAIESATDRRSEPARAYWRLKGLVLHGYFTSERVQKEVLKTEIMPGRFEGAAPMQVRTRSGGSGA